MVEFSNLPNYSDFPALRADLNKYNASLAMSATIAAGSFSNAIIAAATGMGTCRPNCSLATRQQQYQQYYNKGLAEFVKFMPHTNSAAIRMRAWLDTAGARAKEISEMHFKRSAQTQEKYAKSVSTAEEAQIEDLRRGGIEESSRQAQQEIVRKDEEAGVAPSSWFSNLVVGAKSLVTTGSVTKTADTSTSVTAKTTVPIVKPTSTVKQPTTSTIQTVSLPEKPKGPSIGGSLSKLATSFSTIASGMSTGGFKLTSTRQPQQQAQIVMVPTAKKDNKMLIFAVAGGALILLLLLVFLRQSSSQPYYGGYYGRRPGY